MAITLEKAGARVYLNGNTFPVKAEIKAMGGHWDGDRKAWWVGAAKHGEAEALAARLNSAPVSDNGRKVGPDSKVVAKAMYKGRSYYVLWMGRCQSGAEKAHLTVLDGSIDFWADMAACEITKRYSPREYRGQTQYTTLGSIKRFIDGLKDDKANGREVCAECGRSGELVRDLEDGLMKHYNCCDIAP